MNQVRPVVVLACQEFHECAPTKAKKQSVLLLVEKFRLDQFRSNTNIIIEQNRPSEKK
jgi:hypothetical protein